MNRIRARLDVRDDILIEFNILKNRAYKIGTWQTHRQQQTLEWLLFAVTRAKNTLGIYHPPASNYFMNINKKAVLSQGTPRDAL